MQEARIYICALILQMFSWSQSIWANLKLNQTEHSSEG